MSKSYFLDKNNKSQPVKGNTWRGLWTDDMLPTRKRGDNL